jgi:hypothetical protein
MISLGFIFSSAFFVFCVAHLERDERERDEMRIQGMYTKYPVTLSLSTFSRHLSLSLFQSNMFSFSKKERKEKKNCLDQQYTSLV